MPKGNFERSEEHKRNIAESKIGKKRSPETCKAISEGKIRAARKWTPEHRAKIMELRAANPNWTRKGSILTDEHKQKLRDAKLNRTVLLEQYGVTAEQYEAEKLAGNRWCFFKKHFVEAAMLVSRQGVCINCRTEYNRDRLLQNKYGVTQEWYLAKVREQGGGCAICGNPTADSLRNHLNVDHDHANGKNRGVLCSPCNLLMERLDEVPDWLSKAVSYQMRYKREHEAQNRAIELNAKP